MQSFYNFSMKKILLQTEINYYRKRVKSLPKVMFSKWKIRNKMVDMVSVNSNRKRTNTYRVKSKRGQELVKLKEERDKCQEILAKLEAEWLKRYNCPCGTLNIHEYGDTDNRRWFESLKERQNGIEFQSPVFYKEKPYRSKLESDFARIMDDYGIPFKYEPAIILFDGKKKCPDFIIYLPWLDLVILIEIFGKCGDVGYVKKNVGKHLDYIFSGWLPGHNMLCFYYNDNTPYIPEMIMEEIETVALRHHLTNRGAA